MELIEILTTARRMAVFLSNYSAGNIQEHCLRFIKKIDKYIEEENLYK